MLCPSCNRTLQKLSVSTAIEGEKFDIDHCGYCGGTWFDPYEINRIPYHEVVRIAKLTVLPLSRENLNGGNLCPGCKKNLVSFHPEHVPQKVFFLRCPSCKGIFSSSKSLEIFTTGNNNRLSHAGKQQDTPIYPALSILFLPAALLILLFVTTFLTAGSLMRRNMERVRAENIIGKFYIYPRNGAEVSIIFTTSVPLKSAVNFGKSAFDFMRKTVSATPSQTHHVIMAGLDSGSQYLFNIEFEDADGNTMTSGFYRFRTGD